MATPYAPTPSATNMKPSCEIVEYASTFLMSVCTSAIVAAKNAVSAPIAATDRAGLRRMQIDAGQARDQIHAGGDHRRRVDQRRDRRRARHRIGQPDVQRNLRRLAGRADEQQDADQARRHGGNGGPLMNARIDRVHVQRAERLVEHEHAEQEAGVADAVGDEGLLAGARLVGVLEPEADQQIRREPHAFPADEQDQQRPAQHEHQHEEQEQVQVGEVAGVARVVLHVADRVDVDQRADAGDDQHHHRGEAVEVEGDLERAPADDAPTCRRSRPAALRLAAARSSKHFTVDDESQDRQPASDRRTRSACPGDCRRGRSTGSRPAAAGRSG